MTKRRNFTKAIRVEIIKRSTRDGVVYCERCGLPARRFDIHHREMDAMQTDKSRKLTAKDGELLCAGKPETCHSIETKAQMPILAKARDTEAYHLNAKPPSQHPVRSRPSK